MNFGDLSKSIRARSKASWFSGLLVTLIVFLALRIRMFSAKYVFSSDGTVRFISNDAWYHMRVVDSIIHNYPHAMFYNPMTNYPYGSYIHFGPIFDQAIAFVAMLLGAGNPSQNLVDTVGAYFPAVLGALTVVPVYYLGKHLGGKKTGILAAILIAFSPGQFLSRSIVGFTDHHAAETLLSTFFMMFFMLALITAKKQNLSFKQIQNKEMEVLKKPVIYSVLAGIAYASYLLSWPGAPLFAFIVVIFAVAQYVIDHMQNASTDYFTIVGTITFLVETVLILPFIHPEMGFGIFYYSWLHVITSLGAILVFVLMGFLSRELKEKGLAPYYYPAALFGAGVLGLICLKIAAPVLFSLIVNVPGTIFEVKTGGANTIGEASPIFYPYGQFSFSRVYAYFTPQGFYASVLGLIAVAIGVIRKKKVEENLILVWTIIMFLAICGQNRFAYYYSVNVAILAAYLAGKLLESIKWDKLEADFNSNVKTPADLPKFIKSVKLEHVVSVLLIGLVLINPLYSSAVSQASAGGYDPNGYWLESLQWMRYNTPDPGMDYYAISQAPAKGELFKYPDTAYGVMSWWDYGHYIETIAHRMPNANPFQAGIGGRRVSQNETNQPGAATFLTAPSEKEATDVLEAVNPDPQKAGARYVMSDARMAGEIFGAMPAWTLDTEGYEAPVQTSEGVVNLPTMRYYNCMEAQLHIFDGNGLKQYRLVHESPSAYSKSDRSYEVLYKQVYNVLFGGKLSLENTGYVKTFEYVKGANITGTASPSEAVKISTTIKTNQGRTFEYSQSTTADADGKYSFTVPYSTEGPASGETQFDTAPAGPYTVSYGKTTTEVKVPEEAILNGKEIKI